MKQRISKKVIHAGRGNLPSFDPGTKAVFDYQVQVLPEAEGEGDLSVVDDTRKPWPAGYGIPLELVFGKQFMLPIWEECLKTMIPEEVASFDIDPAEMPNYPMVSKKLRDIARDRDKPLTGMDHDHSSSSHSCCGLASQNGLGYPELDALMKQPKPLRITFHLHRILQPTEYEADSWQLDPEQKLNSITALR